MNVGDICKVISQPHNIFVNIVGKVGFISEIKDDYVYFESLRVDGSICGSGAIQLSCLEIENDPIWLHAKSLRDQYVAKIREEGLERGRRWQSKLLEVAEKYSMTVKQVEDLYQELASYQYYM